MARRFPGGTAKSGVERAPGTAVDGFGLYILVCFYCDGDGGVCLRQERERAFAGDRS